MAKPPTPATVPSRGSHTRAVATGERGQQRHLTFPRLRGCFLVGSRRASNLLKDDVGSRLRGTKSGFPPGSKRVSRRNSCQTFFACRMRRCTGSLSSTNAGASPRLVRSLVVLLVCVPAAGCGISRGHIRATAAAPAFTLWVGPFAVRTVEPLDEDGPEATALREVHKEMVRTLGRRPVHEPIEVFLFRDRKRYEAFLASQRGTLPYRRALFVTDGSRRKIYAHRNRGLSRDLRHEAAHALLNAWYGSVPLWLDEGLAEYFETDPEAHHMQCGHVAELWEALRTGVWRPSLERLERIERVTELSRRDYAEAWLWVHLLLQSDAIPPGFLVSYLAAGGKEGPLSVRLRHFVAEPEELVRKHLERLYRKCGRRKPAGNRL